MEWTAEEDGKRGASPGGEIQVLAEGFPVESSLKP